jgi:hypothetical protein
MAWNAYLRLGLFRNVQCILLQEKFTSVGMRSYINGFCGRSYGFKGPFLSRRVAAGRRGSKIATAQPHGRDDQRLLTIRLTQNLTHVAETKK